MKMAITEYIRNVDRAILNTVFDNTVRPVNKRLETGGDALNISCNILYCNHQFHREFLITLYMAEWRHSYTRFKWRLAVTFMPHLFYLCSTVKLYNTVAKYLFIAGHPLVCPRSPHCSGFEITLN
jgi:hypothetical protein